MSSGTYAYHKQWRVDRAHGVTRIIDAAPARRRIHTLLGQGWSLRAIAGAAGISPTSVHRIHHDQTRANRKVVEAILAIRADALPVAPSSQTTEPFVPRIGTVRRIQALLYMGYPHHLLAEHSGLRTGILLSQQGRWVTRTTHEKVAALYDQLAMTPGPSNLTRGRARRLGYSGPLAWDDIDSDLCPAHQVPDEISVDVLADVDEVAIQRRMNGDKAVRLNTEERVELVRRWKASGRPLNECERVTGLKPERYRADAEVRTDPPLTAQEAS